MEYDKSPPLTKSTIDQLIEYFDTNDIAKKMEGLHALYDRTPEGQQIFSISRSIDTISTQKRNESSESPAEAYFNGALVAVHVAHKILAPSLYPYLPIMMKQQAIAADKAVNSMLNKREHYEYIGDLLDISFRGYEEAGEMTRFFELLAPRLALDRGNIEFTKWGFGFVLSSTSLVLEKDQIERGLRERRRVDGKFLRITQTIGDSK